jgi:hypothetical protein
MTTYATKHTLGVRFGRDGRSIKREPDAKLILGGKVVPLFVVETEPASKPGKQLVNL